MKSVPAFLLTRYFVSEWRIFKQASHTSDERGYFDYQEFRILRTHSWCYSEWSDCFGRNIPRGARVSSFTRFLDHSQRSTTVGSTPVDEWSARRRDRYLKTHNTHNRQTSMPPVGFEPTILAGERPQTYALDRAATWTGILNGLKHKQKNSHSKLHTERGSKHLPLQ